jgi:hypothetical protein
MRLLVIPDVHGSTTWRAQINEALFMPDTHIVFLGDYVDNYFMSSWMILKNFENIIALKKKYPEKITLLLGNHDYAYVFGHMNISGFDFHRWIDYRELINSNWNLFDLAWGYQGKKRYTLLTHAGLTQSFYETVITEINNPESILHDIIGDEFGRPGIEMPLHELLNYFINQSHIMWQIGLYRRGFFSTGSILWADKRELINDRYKGIDQIVGHTAHSFVDIKHMDEDILYFIDTHTRDTVTGFMIDLD